MLVMPMSSYRPMDIEDQVRSYVCDVIDDCVADRITSVRPFESGERHAVFKVSYLDPPGVRNDVVVRISLTDNDVERAESERESAVLTKVQGVAAPVLYDYSGESPWFQGPAMCMQFVSGEQRDLRRAADHD